jgi:hypothetical protein
MIERAQSIIRLDLAIQYFCPTHRPGVHNADLTLLALFLLWLAIDWKYLQKVETTKGAKTGVAKGILAKFVIFQGDSERKLQ